MTNAVILHCPGDEDRARWIGQSWRGGRATVCIMGPKRERIALGAQSVLIGLWSERSDSPDEGRQMANVLAQSPGRSLLVVWDGRPPLDAATGAGVPVLVAPEDPVALTARLADAAAGLINMRPLATELGARARAKAGSATQARLWGAAIGVALGGLIAAAAMAPLAARFIPGATPGADESGMPR